MGERNVTIGGNVSGSAVVTGDQNTTEVRYQRAVLPPAASVDIRAEIGTLAQLLAGLNTGQRQKIANALSEAADDAGRVHPDKDEIGKSLERALDYASKAADFSDKSEQIVTHVQRVVAWLGDNWHKLLPLVGLTL
jgi:ABC-type transporter Mla subunit MlaD